MTTVVAGAGVTALTWAVVPSVSTDFWGRLTHGDTGLGGSIVYYTNQSVMADVIRVFGLGSTVSAVALLLAALVAAIGVWAAVLWHRLGDVVMAVTLCGIAGLLASPVSWSHHFVWVVPFALCLAGLHRRPPGGRLVPVPFAVAGWVFIGWVVAAPYKRLPNGADVELTWTWYQHWLASMTAVLGLGVLVAAVIVARRMRQPAAEPVAEPSVPR